MATQTASNATAGAMPKSSENRVIAQPFYFNSGATSIDASATTINLCKIPHGATVLGYSIYHSIGAATCPADYGRTGSLSAYGTAQAKSAYNVQNVGPSNASYGAGVPSKISLSDDAVARFTYFTGTYTPGTATTSLIVQGQVLFTMDGV